jgi:3-phenylpropionate/cinnamic acid dioxygenase small subunit
MTSFISDELQRIKLQQEVEAFLYAEARMLEDNRFDDWLDCFSDDVRYWMPVREHIEHHTGVPGSTDSFALFDDDKQSLELRTSRIKTGMAPCEIPLSVTQRLITNVMVKAASGGDGDNKDDRVELEVYSTFMIYQERRGRHGVTFFGRREDLMRRDDDRLRIARRKIELAQMILPSTISIFF